VPDVKAAGPTRRLLTATQIAAFCDVDLKTIHNWADRGKIRGWRTSGRHLRFRRLDVVDFLRTYGFSIPDVLRENRPRVVAVDSDPQGLAWMRRALARRFEVTGFEHVIDGLVALAEVDPDVALLGDVSPLNARAVATRLCEVEATHHVRIVTLDSIGEATGARGGVTERPAPSVARGDTAKLREVMERVTGID
jgi:excisionase family DNA binding protein